MQRYVDRDDDPRKAPFGLAPHETRGICPYDKNHFFSSQDIIAHLHRCRSWHLRDRNEKNLEPLFICHYNKEHHVPDSKHPVHLATCDSKYWVQATAHHYMYSPLTTTAEGEPLKKIAKSEIPMAPKMASSPPLGRQGPQNPWHKVTSDAPTWKTANLSQITARRPDSRQTHEGSLNAGSGGISPVHGDSDSTYSLQSGFVSLSSLGSALSARDLQAKNPGMGPTAPGSAPSSSGASSIATLDLEGAKGNEVGASGMRPQSLISDLTSETTSFSKLDSTPFDDEPEKKVEDMEVDLKEPKPMMGDDDDEDWSVDDDQAVQVAIPQLQFWQRVRTGTRAERKRFDKKQHEEVTSITESGVKSVQCGCTTLILEKPAFSGKFVDPEMEALLQEDEAEEKVHAFFRAKKIAEAKGPKETNGFVQGKVTPEDKLRLKYS